MCVCQKGKECKCILVVFCVLEMIRDSRILLDDFGGENDKSCVVWCVRVMVGGVLCAGVLGLYAW